MKRWMIVSVLSLAVSLCYMGSALAAKWSVPGDFATIQEAIDDGGVVDGDTIDVAAGTYFGATVTKAVKIKAKGKVIINDGPFSHGTFLRAGFLFPPGGSGSGATISGFTIVGAAQFGGFDDGQIDFPIFSRGANNVTIERNKMTDSLQAITDWNGSGWRILRNEIKNLWTLNGGGIGILTGSFNGSVITGTIISHNKISGTLSVYPFDLGGYNGTGIVLFADFRGVSTGAQDIEFNLVEKNKISLTSDRPGVVNAQGIELTAAPEGADPAVIHDNIIKKNDLKKNSGDGIELQNVEGNLIEKNKISENGENGVKVDTESSGNTFSKNDSKKNGEYGFKDLSGGSNNYDKNKCSKNGSGGSDPFGSGFCGPQP